MDPRKQNRVKCNISEDELDALKELIRLQRERIITIKACDKGAGIIILNFDEYMRAAYKHLGSKQPQAGGALKNRFELVEEITIQKGMSEILAVLENGLKNKIITQKEFEAMDPSDKDLARFYCNFKVHKHYEHKTAPPPRPIVSGSGSMTENSSIFVQHHIKEVSKTHPSYLQDTPDFLRTIDKINEGPDLPKDAMLVTMDATGLFDNIPHDEGLETLTESLNEQENQNIPTS